MSSDPVPQRLEWVRSRLEAAVAARIVAEPDAQPADRRASPELAWDAVQDADLAAFEGRVGEAAARLGLDELSLDVLWLCAAPELDDRLGHVFGFLLDNASQRLPTPRLIASLLAADGVAPVRVLAHLDADASLRRQGCVRLLDGDDAMPVADQAVRVAPELAAFLLESSLHEAGVDVRLQRRELPRHPMGRTATLDRIRAALAAHGEAPVLVSGQDAADVLAFATGRGLLVLDARAANDAELLSRARLIAALEDRVLAFNHGELLTPMEAAALEAVIESGVDRALLCAAGASLGNLDAIAIEVPMPTLAERREAWTALAASPETDEVAAKFRLSTGQIARAAQMARVEAEIAGRDVPDGADLDAGARHASRSALGGLAVRLPPDREWAELVLPQRQLDQLRSISAYLRHRDQVLTEWGFEHAVSGRVGLGVLFAGESGTGKTMAARVLAADLGLELFAINLATVVSKYVGETEQNLERIFAAAEGSNAILLFDEADALFGRRSDVSDSSDRYANIEVAYLLQRMEAYTGAIILTTNLKQNLDAAFLRRLDFVIDFRFPEEPDRRRMWAMVTPAEAPVAEDMDFEFLGDRFKLSGGSIRNCSLAAAFEAASAGQPVRMAHIIRAIAVEYGKLGRLTVESDFGRYFGMLRDPEASPSRDAAAPPAPEAPAAHVRIGSRI